MGIDDDSHGESVDSATSEKMKTATCARTTKKHRVCAGACKYSEVSFGAGSDGEMVLSHGPHDSAPAHSSQFRLTDISIHK